jgi:hypothetical protein
MTRNRWKKGDWLIIDQESGVTRYASEVIQDWKGLYVTERYADSEQPQDFVRALDDPKPVPFASLPDTNFDVCNVLPYYIGNTRVKNPTNGPADHLYRYGIGEAKIGCSFIVY